MTPTDQQPDTEPDVLDAVPNTQTSPAAMVRQDPPQLPASPAGPAEITALTADQLASRMNLVIEATKKVMVDGVDYGTIPGCDKPTLYQAGAQKLSMLFQMAPTFVVETIEHEGGHREHRVTCNLSHIPSGLYLGSGTGSCSTLEAKYRYRRGERKCPDCGHAPVLKSKDRPEWYCWKKKGGCGKTWPIADPAIASQAADRGENPDIADTYNTVLKIACKRSFVAAVMPPTGASAVYTQDVEDMPPFGGDGDTKDKPAAETAATGASKPASETAITKIAETRQAKEDGAIRYGIYLGQPDVWLTTTDKTLADEARRYCELGERVQVTATALEDKATLLSIVPAPRSAAPAGDTLPEGEQALDVETTPAMNLYGPVGKAGETDPTIDTPVRVTKRMGTTRGKAWTLFKIYGTSGEAYTTFDSSVAHFCFHAAQAERPCLLQTEAAKKKDMPDTVIGVALDKPSGDHEPVEPDDIPF